MMRKVSEVSAFTSDTLALFQMTGCPPGSEHRCQIASEVESRYRFLKDNNTLGSAALCTVDVGDDDMFVVDMILTIFETGKISFAQGSCINQTVAVDFVMAQNPIIFTYVSFETTRLISSLLSVDLTDSIMLIAVTEQAMFPNALLERTTFVYSYDTSYTLEMHQHSFMDLKDHFQISYVAFLYLKDYEEDEITINKPCDERSDTAYCFYKEQDRFEHKNCYKEKMVRGANQFKEAIELLRMDPHLRTMIVYGYGPVLTRFSMYIDSHHSDFFILPFERKTTNSSVAETNLDNYWLDKFPGQISINNLLTYIYQIKTELFVDHDMYKALKNTGLLQVFVKENRNFLKPFGFEVGNDNELAFDTWQALGEISFLRKVIIDAIMSWDNVKKFMIYWKVDNYKYLVEPERLLNLKSLFNPKSAIEAKPYCNTTVPMCPPGEELQHSEFKETNWDNSYGWHCRRCLAKMYKNETGNTRCMTCRYPFTTDANHTLCFDPFAMRHLNWDGPVEMAALALSTLTVALVVFTSELFVKYKNTPVVRHTNLPMSVIQLSLHFVLSVSSFTLFVSYPGNVVCTLRPLVVGLCLTINAAVNIGKTQKLYVIFNAKTVHSASERRLVKRLDWLIIVMVILVDGAIFIVFNVSGNTGVLLTYHDEELVKEATCSNNIDIIIQLVFLLSLIFVNGVNAFKARRLPSHFKETTHVIYSSFTSVVSLSGLMAIYFTQRKMLAKEMVLMVFVIAVNLMHFLLIYSYKVFVIVFRPQQNTVQAFNAMRQAHLQKQFQTKWKNVLLNAGKNIFGCTTCFQCCDLLMKPVYNIVKKK